MSNVLGIASKVQLCTSKEVHDDPFAEPAEDAWAFKFDSNYRPGSSSRMQILCFGAVFDQFLRRFQSFWRRFRLFRCRGRSFQCRFVLDRFPWHFRLFSAPLAIISVPFCFRSCSVLFRPFLSILIWFVFASFSFQFSFPFTYVSFLFSNCFFVFGFVFDLFAFRFCFIFVGGGSHLSVWDLYVTPSFP